MNQGNCPDAGIQLRSAHADDVVRDVSCIKSEASGSPTICKQGLDHVKRATTTSWKYSSVNAMFHTRVS